jgi:DNA/RNA-binding domain of Phe-tRNA-synthetase-like protein
MGPVNANIFAVTPACVDLGLRAGAVVLRGVSVGPAGAGLRDEIACEVDRIRARYGEGGSADLRSSPEIQGLYAVFRAVGVKPRRQPPSIEKLIQYALRKGDLPVVNNLVDAYNLMSVRTNLSMGAHDLDRIELPVTLTTFTGNESFIPLGMGGESSQAVRAGEFGYVDAAGRVLCRLDVLQAEFSKVTAETRNALLIIEATASVAVDRLRRAFAETLAFLELHSGGAGQIVSFPG